MTEMVERVARAIWKARQDTAKRDYRIELEEWGDGTFPKANHVFEEACAAIEAMREPTEAMVQGGRSVNFGRYPTVAWQAMIDAALK